MSRSVRRSTNSCTTRAVTKSQSAHARVTSGVASRSTVVGKKMARGSRSGANVSRVVCQAAAKYDYDVAIIGCGVGGHGAALHAVQQGLKTCIIEGHDIGGTCVNRGCVPSKALLAASGRIREMQNDMHLKAMGIQV